MSLFQLVPQYGVTGILAGVFVAWGLASVIAGRFLSLRNINWYKLILLASATFLFAVSLEIIANGLYHALFHTYLWEYKVYPVHGGSTSFLAVFFWPLYGIYLYFLHEALKIRKWDSLAHWKRGMLSGFDGPMIEIILNTFFLLLHQTLFFYYFPSDIFHFTTLQIVPVYAFGGIILAYALHYLEQAKKVWAVPVVLYMAGIAVLLF